MQHKSFKEQFKDRHIGPGPAETKEMLEAIGVDSLDKLIDETIPADIREDRKLDLKPAVSEYKMLQELKQMASENKVYRSYIGMGYYNCITPGVIQRNIFENPGWYTAYTPYQAEISQGRLEALLNYQTMVMELTGMEIANASLLDEGTAAAEAMSLLYQVNGRKKGNAFYVSENCFPQTLDLLKTRATPLGIELKIMPAEKMDFSDDAFGVFLQYPDGDGAVNDLSTICQSAKDAGLMVAVATDLLALTLLTPPGEFGADVVVGSSQRFGVPVGYGGPHAAFFATKEIYKRQVPGRIIGVSVDSQGKKAFRMALQTREQHIRREKATSNICTAQVLLGVMAATYALYHGPEGLKHIARRIHGYTRMLEKALTAAGFKQLNKSYFDTLLLDTDLNQSEQIKRKAIEKEINFRYYKDGKIGISLDETVNQEDMNDLIEIFTSSAAVTEPNSLPKPEYPENLQRKSAFLEHPVFNLYHSETDMLRYLKYLENKDLSLTHSMIPLGSCTMKLNATTEMQAVTWPEFGSIHPFAPQEQAKGYHRLFEELSHQLKELTGFDAVSLQPNSGAQGEYAGLMVIRSYFIDKGEEHRNIALIPSSAHGTNPASAVMAGMKVVVVKCDEKGNIDTDDLRNKAEMHKDNLAALMVTYPSTHGVFEVNIKEVCDIIHQNGGQVYLDGANMNAQLGLSSPAYIGADVCHLNLHKTFCIPHGGGGPGMGPIAAKEHLAPYMPGHPVVKTGGNKQMSSISAAPWGSAGILLISYVYIRLMGAEGLTEASKYAILNANYIKAKLENFYPVLYKGHNGRIAHEMVLDTRVFKAAGVEVEDIAKRLMDYGFHAPTMSWPVPGTLMVEPTESESKAEIDRFCKAMISIRKEIEEIENGTADSKDNVMKNSPHTQEVVMADEWTHTYSRSKAAFPLSWLRSNKFWATVGRIDSTQGDRNLVCACPPIEEYLEHEEVNEN